MYKNLVLLFALFAMASFAIGQDTGISTEDLPAPVMDQKEENDSGIEQLTAEGERNNEAPIPADSEVSGGEEQSPEGGADQGEEQKPAEEESQAPEEIPINVEKPTDEMSAPLTEANEKQKVENVEEVEPKEEQPTENVEPEAENNVVPIEGERPTEETAAVEQDPEDVRQNDSAEKKVEETPKPAPIVEEFAPKVEEKAEEKIEEKTPESKVDESNPEVNASEKKEEDKVEDEEKKEDEEKPKVDSTEQNAANNSTIDSSLATTNAKTNSTSTTPATDNNKPSFWSRIMCLFIHFGCPTFKDNDQKAGNRTETATRGIRAQGIVFIGGGAADSSSESDEEELGSAEKDHQLSGETTTDGEKKDEGEEKPTEPEATDATAGEKEGKEKGIQIKGSIKLDATVMHSEVDSDGKRRSNITQINAELAN